MLDPNDARDATALDTGWASAMLNSDDALAMSGTNSCEDQAGESTTRGALCHPDD